MVRFVLVFAGSLSFASAQTALVVPPSHAAREGSAATNVPFGRSTAMRCQIAYEGALFPRAGSIERLAFRLDGGATAAAKQLDLALRAATGPASVLALQATFAWNPGSDDREVLARRLVDLPAQPGGQTPSPFALSFPFDTPFPYDPRGGCLLLDLTVHGQPPGTYPLDLTWVCDSPVQRYGPAGCGQPLVVDAATTQVMWGQPLDLRVSAARAGSLAGVLLGSLEQGSWGGIVLPFDLAAVGAPGCHLSIDILAAAFAPASALGVATFPFALPARPDLVGATIRFQGCDLDPTANVLGLVTSQPAKVAVCGWERVGRVWATGAAATTGTREVGLAPPAELTMR